jgi:hypothetical protein
MKNPAKELIATLGFDTYDYEAKQRWHNLARQVLRYYAKRLDLAPGSYDIRSNKAGPACSGEVTLHAEKVYFQLSADNATRTWGFLYRHCDGLKDYTGGANRWMKPELLADERAVYQLLQEATNGA